MADVVPDVEMRNLASSTKKKNGRGLSWKNITFEVQGKRKILKGVSGASKSFTAIMGPSGAGKSTLMNILAGRLRGNRQNIVGGEVFYNGQKVDPVTFASNIAYVMQEDAIKATTTPREAFHFSAALRLGSSVTEEERHKRVEDLIEELRLSKCADTMVGNARLRIPGISGGERKRTAIGVELISNPAIVFLDEPTSGLDSFAAHRVVTVLNRLASKGRTVLCTIHQPSSEVFSVFDDVLLIADGRLVYHDKRTSMNSYFESLGHKCPSSYNPADFVMFLMQEASDSEIKGMCDTWTSRDSKCMSIEDVESGESKKEAKVSASSKTDEADDDEKLNETILIEGNNGTSSSAVSHMIRGKRK